jgi:hypothetical protein
MPAISGLNGGVVKATPSDTDLIPAQESGGTTVPISVAGLVAKVLADPSFATAVNALITTSQSSGAFDTAVDARITAALAGAAFAEAVDDQVAALLVAGTGVTVTYNDAANTITITAP